MDPTRSFIAWVLRYRSKLREAVCKRREGQYESLKAGVIYPISVEELVRAENEIVKHVQGTSFLEELIRLGDQSINDTTNVLKVKYVKKVKWPSEDRSNTKRKQTSYNCPKE